MLGLAPDVRDPRPRPRDPRRTTCGPARCLLVRAVQYLPDDCVVVAVVDPGVGTDRRLVGVEVAGGVLLGPDNGLLAPAVAMAGGARAVVSRSTTPSTSSPRPGPPSPGATCSPPRPVTWPPACRSPSSAARSTPPPWCPGLVSLPEVRDDGSIVGEVWWVDRFGNCQLNIDPDELGAGGAGPGARVEVHLARRDPRRALGAHLRRRQAVGAGAAGRLLRAARAGLDRELGRDRTRAAAPAAASPWCPRAGGRPHHPGRV